MGDPSLQVHFSAYADEPVPRAFNPNPTGTSNPLNLVSDDPAWWSAYTERPRQRRQRLVQWQWAPRRRRQPE